MPVLYANNAASRLSASITNVATSFSVTAGHGARFPAISGGDHFYATLMDSAGNLEVVRVTARATDTFTVQRAQEGTTARAYAANDVVELRITRAMLDDLKTDTRAALTSGNVTTALGFTPYNATNPSAFINQAGARTALSFTAGSGAYNSSTGVITIPTNTNQLTNGAGYITADATKLPLAGGTMTGDLSFAATAGLTRIVGGVSGGNTTLVLQAGGTTGIGANIELTRDFFAFVDATETRIRSLDGATVFSAHLSGSSRFAGALRIGSLNAPEGQLDFPAEGDARWLARGGRLDVVNAANTAWSFATIRGSHVLLQTPDAVSRFGVYPDGRAYCISSGARGFTGYLLTVVNDSIANALRAGGYIEYQTDVGAIGVNYFNSDARLKKNIAPTAKTARQAIDQIEFKQFDWNEFTDQNNEHVELGVVAQQLQQVNPKFVNEMSDSTLGVNEPELLTYALKAIQELSAELSAVRQELIQLQGAA